MIILIDIISYFPNIHQEYFNHSFFKKFIENQKVKLNLHSILQISKSLSIMSDNKPYGHSKGMILNTTIIDHILNNIINPNLKNIIIHPSPSGYQLQKNL